MILPSAPEPQRVFTLADFDFHLPPELIAQHPPAERSGSRLLDGRQTAPADRRFTELPETPAWNSFQLAASHPASGQFALARKIGDVPNEVRIYRGADGPLTLQATLSLPGLVNHLAFDRTGERLAVTRRNGTLEVFATGDGQS